MLPRIRFCSKCSSLRKEALTRGLRSPQEPKDLSLFTSAGTTEVVGIRLAPGRLVATSAFLFLVAVAFAIGLTHETFAAQAAAIDLSKLAPAIHRRVDYLKDVHPILAASCYSCHGEEKQKGGLRLDVKLAALKGGENGRVIIPRKSAESPLIHNVSGLVEDKVMPPKGNRLNAEQIGLLRAWIDQGAVWPEAKVDSKLKKKAEHWAFKPVANPAAPRVRDKAWVRNPVDAFVLAKLDAKKLKPSPPADKRTLIRRASYDLTGLPPTSEEVEDFLADISAGAFGKVVERLLASPRYGERWGRYWLDVARYADTKGYVYGREERRFAYAHTYRDWVIRAFNEDLPYDQFLLQQIAADQLAPPGAFTNRPGTTNTLAASDNSALAAMGFLTIGRRFLGITHDIIDDRIDVVMRGTQGLTVACARCHDHKFDPIPTKDYYALYGVFAGSTEKTVCLDTMPERSTNYLAYEKELEKRVGKFNVSFQAKCDQLSERLRGKIGDYLAAVINADKLPGDDFTELLGPNDVNPVIIKQWQAYLFQTSKRSDPIFAPWHALVAIPEAEFAAKAPMVWQAFTSQPTSRLNPRVAQVLIGPPPASMQEVAQRYGKLLAEVDRKWTEAVQAAKKSNGIPPGALADAGEEALRQVLYGLDSPANVYPGNMVDLEWHFDNGNCVELWAAQNQIDQWNIGSPGAPPHAVILLDRLTQWNPRVFRRGNPGRRGDEVPRQFLQVLAGEKRQPFKHGSGRLELARAIASKDNPLTARVMVNRIWLHHFGAGLVRTPSDFGTRSESPSHPELLDWLARRFMAEGWSIKKMHRLLMSSDTYQQSSDDEALPSTAPSTSGKMISAAAQSAPSQIDPDNRLLWRMNRDRLDFEAMRDSLLAASGELESKLGGPAVDLNAQPFTTRRTVYGSIDRQFLPGLFRVFDFANPDMHSPQRFTTTVPQQALFFINSPFVVERARALVNRKEVQALATTEEKIQRLFRIVYQRPATPPQVETSRRFLQAAQTESGPRPQPVASAWQHGYGEFDEATQRIKKFEKLPHFTGEAWQGGAAWPDVKLGWVQLTAEGGHAGNDLQHAAIRRWVAPRDGTVAISGTVAHEHEPGDGIRARIVSSRGGQLASWTLHKEKAAAVMSKIVVQQGDTIDFVVDFNAGLNTDMFKWSPVIKMSAAPTNGAVGELLAEWSDRKEFNGLAAGPTKPMTAWEKFAQVLLLSNEFMFVD